MRTGNERKSSSSSPSPDWDVGLGLKIQTLRPAPQNLTSAMLAVVAPSSVTRAAARPAISIRAPITPLGFSEIALLQVEKLCSQSLNGENWRYRTRYILASIPVPPQLLHPSGSDFRFGSSDPEPWRCKRTDGKKWRCSMDVAPEHKYCERHAHKSKPRSRKHVEISSSSSPSPSLPAAPHPFQRSTSSSQIPPSMDQTRSIEWFMRGGNSKQQPRSEPDRDDSSERQGFYVPDTSTLQMDSSPQTTTRHLFVDAWEKDIGMSNKIKKLSASSSLSLSMCGNWKDNGDDNIENMHSGIGMMSSSWMNSSSSSSPIAPGGPLGEALCQGRNAGKNTNSSKSTCEDGSHALDFVGCLPTDGRP